MGHAFGAVTSVMMVLAHSPLLLLAILLMLGAALGRIRGKGISLGPAAVLTNPRTSFDTRVSLGYALVHPTAMVGKILLARALVPAG